MIGLFSFDGPLYKDCNGVYCNTTITNQMLERYFCVVDKLYILIRVISLDVTYCEARLSKLEIGDNIVVVGLPNIKSPKEFINIRKYERLIQPVLDECDLFFLRIPSVISDLVARLCIRSKKDYLVEVGGCAWDAHVNHSLLGKIIAPVMYLHQKKTVSRASCASYVTQHWLQCRYPCNREQIVASNVYLSTFDDRVIEKRILKTEKPLFTPRTIGTIASVDVRYKGQEYVIRALRILKRRGIYIDYELVGAGEGKYLKSIARKCGVEEQVHFVGVKEHDDIWEWLEKIDIYAQPSKQEGLPRALIEAMNMGCICIGSSTAGIPELLEPDYIFANFNPKQIADIVERIYNNHNFEQIIMCNYEKTKQFDLDVLNKRRTRLFEYYRDICLDKHGRSQ